MNGVVFDPERNIWLLVVDGAVSSMYASQTAALVASQELAEGAGE